MRRLAGDWRGDWRRWSVRKGVGNTSLRSGRNLGYNIYDIVRFFSPDARVASEEEAGSLRHLRSRPHSRFFHPRCRPIRVGLPQSCCCCLRHYHCRRRYGTRVACDFTSVAYPHQSVPPRRRSPRRSRAEALERQKRQAALERHRLQKSKRNCRRSGSSGSNLWIG